MPHIARTAFETGFSPTLGLLVEAIVGAEGAAMRLVQWCENASRSGLGLAQAYDLVERPRGTLTERINLAVDTLCTLGPGARTCCCPTLLVLPLMDNRTLSLYGFGLLCYQLSRLGAHFLISIKTTDTCMINPGKILSALLMHG